MTPMPVKPTVVIELRNGAVVNVASNIARTDDPNDPLTVTVVETPEAYAEAALGKPFDSTRPVTV
jgi:hypothetical protein